MIAGRLRGGVIATLGVALAFMFSVAGNCSADRTSAEVPPGFFVADIGNGAPVPVFYNLATHLTQAFPLRQHYTDFIDFCWDRARQRVFFSARVSPKDPYRVYMKRWPDGEEKIVYESPVGPFRFLLSPDGQRLALQIMGRSAWPILAVNEWQSQRTVSLGQGHSPDWSTDSQKLLFLQIPGSLPSYLYEYDVSTDTATRLVAEPVMEAVYTDDPQQIILKTASQAKTCDVFQILNTRSNRLQEFGQGTPHKGKTCVDQRDVGAFPGHRFFYFKESPWVSDRDKDILVVSDVWGGRLQELPREDWDPSATAVEDTALVVGDDPLYVLSADGTGGRLPIPNAAFIRPQR